MQLFDPGFVSENLLTLRFHLPATSAPAERLDRFVERVRSVPGVAAAAVASHLYFGSGYMSGPLTVEGYQPRSAGEELRSYRHYVMPGYFEAMGIPLRSGRGFEEGDGANAPGVVVVNDSFARTMWPGESAVGKRVAFGERWEGAKWLTVAGVVGDVEPRIRFEEGERLPQVYVPVHQGGDWSRALVVRVSTEPTSIVPGLRRALRELDPGIAVFDVAPMEELIARSRATSRVVSYLMGAFAGLALLLSSVGLYGVVSFAVGRSTHEMGVRLALGAERRSVVAIVMQRSLPLAAMGLGAGLLASFAVTRALAPLLYQVDPLDGATYLAVLILMGLVVLVASLVPAVRAGSTDPVVALRHD
jgi:predicted permease